MATASPRSKDERRRRIVDRGSDRLALITGRIHNLQPSSSFSSPKSRESPSSSLHSYQASCPPFLSDQSNPVFPEGENTGSRPSLQKSESNRESSLQKSESNRESGQLNYYDGGSRAEPYMRMRKFEKRSEVSSRPAALESADEVPSFPVSSTVQDPFLSISTSKKEPHFDLKAHLRKIFSPNQISSAIAATEKARLYCSFLVAILVVLSYVGFPILGSHFIKSIFFSRPLYLLLLTNISIVVALLLGEQGGKERADQEGNSLPQIPPIGGSGLFDNLGFALESGLVLQKVVGALFMNCGVYAVVLVCSLPLAQKLGL